MNSLREQSLSTIQEAIRSPHDAGATLKRVNAVLGQYYDPDFDPETKALVREEFVRALQPYPGWAVHQAFDVWVRSMQRRPSPAEIVILIGRAMKPLTDEITRRKKIEDEIAEAKRAEEITPEQMEQRRAYANRVMQRLGYSKAPLHRDGPPRATVTEEDLQAYREGRL